MTNCKMQIFAGIESALDELRLKLEPASCLEANENGAQFLRNGDKVYCDGKWTVSLNKMKDTYVYCESDV